MMSPDSSTVVALCLKALLLILRLFDRT